MKEIKTALVGCGRIGFLLENDPLRYKPCTHFGAVKAAGMKITHACDINIQRLDQFAERAGLARENLFTDYKKLLPEVKPDLVIIATWTDTHADIGILSAKNGARAVICEKPIASDLSDAEILIEECRKSCTSLIINHERRYDDRYRAVKKLLASGKIGKIKTVNACVLTSGYHGKSALEEGGGPLLHDGTHLIDIIRYLLGDIKAVSGEFQRYNRKKGYEDRAAAWLKTESGIDVFIEAGGSRRYFAFELTIWGTDGKIVIGNGYEYLYMNKKSEFYTGFRDLSPVPFPKTGGTDYYKREYLEARKAATGKKVSISSSGEDGYKALEVIHGIYLSSFKKGEWINLPVNPGRINLKEIFNI